MEGKASDLHKPHVFHGNELGLCVPDSWKQDDANNFKSHIICKVILIIFSNQ